MNKGLFITLFGLVISITSLAQTGIGTTTPNASAKLDVSATDKGFLPPRIALTASNVASPITSPANGLLVYNTATAGSPPNNVIPGYYFWNGSAWINMIGSTTSSTITGNGTTSTIANFGSVINEQTSNYTLTNIDNGEIVIINSSSATTITVPSLSVGFNCLIVQRGTGQITVTGSGVTINNRYGFTKTAGQHSIMTLVCIATGVFIASGDMTN
ncbi:hypothetical protein [Aquirufa sp. 5-AUSEE-100C1]